MKPYDNIPVISYLVLGGKCRACKKSYSWIYPAVEFLTGLLFLAVAWKSGPTWVAVAEMAFVAVIVALIFIDAQHQLLPNVITYPAFLFFLTFAALTFSLKDLFSSDIWLFPLDKKATLPLDPFHYAYFEQHTNFEVMMIGALILACAVPIFWLIDRLDNVLFGRYFDQDEDDVDPSPEAIEKEQKLERQHNLVVYPVMIVGLLLAVLWAVWVYSTGNKKPEFVTSATDLLSIKVLFVQLHPRIVYPGLLKAVLGALVGGGIIWLLRAAYFWTRGFEGMGLGDVKMMGVIGAFLGWQQSILVIMVGSLLGSIVGLILARRSADGLRTALPFGIFLGIAAILSLFFGEFVITWYAGNLRQ